MPYKDDEGPEENESFEHFLVETFEEYNSAVGWLNNIQLASTLKPYSDLELLSLSGKIKRFRDGIATEFYPLPKDKGKEKERSKLELLSMLLYAVRIPKDHEVIENLNCGFKEVFEYPPPLLQETMDECYLIEDESLKEKLKIMASIDRLTIVRFVKKILELPGDKNEF